MQIMTRLEPTGAVLASSGDAETAFIRFFPEGALGSSPGTIMSPEFSILAIGPDAASRLHDYLSEALVLLEAAVAQRGEALVVEPLPFPQSAASERPTLTDADVAECSCPASTTATHAPWCHLNRVTVGITLVEDEPR